MKATDLLRGQHREVLALFDRLRGPIGAREAEAVARELGAVFGAHLAVEQQSFYLECARAFDDRSVLLASYREHAAAAEAVRSVLALAGDDPGFGAAVERARRLIADHITHEEHRLFPHIDPILGDKRSEVVGALLEAAFDDAVALGPEVTLADGAVDERDLERAFAAYEPNGERMAPSRTDLHHTRKDANSAVHHAAARIDIEKPANEGHRRPHSGAEGARKTREGDRHTPAKHQ